MNITQKCSRIKIFRHHSKPGATWTDSSVPNSLKIRLLLTPHALLTLSSSNGHVWTPFLHVLINLNMVTPFAPMFQHLVADKNPALPTAACTNTTHMTRIMITADRVIPFGKDANRHYVYDVEPLATEQ